MALRKLSRELEGRIKDSSHLIGIFRYNPVYYRRAIKIISLVSGSAEQACNVRSEMLDRTLSWAARTRYGARYGRNLEDWPVLTKSDLLADPAKYRCRRQFAVSATTGGSTGIPLRLWRSLECIAAEQAILDSLVGRASESMRNQRVAVLRADFVKDPGDGKPPFGVWRNNGRWLILSNAHLSRTNLPWFADTLTSFQPDILWVYPTALSNLLRLADEAGLRISVPTILSSSEMLTESLFTYASQFFGSRVIDLYGQSERVSSAHCIGSRDYFFDKAYGHVELIPEPEDNSDESPATARIIATGYWNSAFPLVRYDTGDRVILPSSLDAHSIALIAEGSQPFSGIVGRADDYLHGRDGERIAGMNHIPRNLDDVLRIQIIQDSHTSVRILVLPKSTLTAHDRQVIEENARELLPPYIRLHIIAVDKLSSLPNGKTPFIIRRI